MPDQPDSIQSERSTNQAASPGRDVQVVQPPSVKLPPRYLNAVFAAGWLVLFAVALGLIARYFSAEAPTKPEREQQARPGPFPAKGEDEEGGLAREPARQEPPAFDAESFLRTCDWMRHLAEEWDTFSDNELADRRTGDDIRGKMEALKGKVVNWPLTVQKVDRAPGGKATVYLEAYGSPLSHDAFHAAYFAKEFFRLRFPQTTVELTELSMDAERAGRLRFGSWVNVKGEISGASLGANWSELLSKNSSKRLMLYEGRITIKPTLITVPD